tara:strand:+ start:2314 stop:4029 length:1716 start_codon:yes stop_codon:yes gene_type:complete
VSKEFIKDKIGGEFLAIAKRQQKQLSYFTQSTVQEDLTQTYLDAWAERNYQTNDDFLNWVKMLFRTDNFLTYFKYQRYPVASSKLVNNKIKPQLSRVFHSDDSYFKYLIKGKEEHAPEFLNEKDFNHTIFDALMFRHNDIIIQDMSAINEPYRQLISIDNVVAVHSTDSNIHKLAYAAVIEVEGKEVNGIAYMDKEVYAFYDKNLDQEPLFIVPHDLGICPADWVSNESFGSDNDIVRKSIFSHVKPDFEEYVFLKTLQKLTDPNGAFPVITMLDAKTKDNSSRGKKGLGDKEPMSSLSIGSQESAEQYKTVQGSSSVVQAGTIIKAPIIRKDDGSVDMNIVQNYLNFFHHPVESLKYIKERIQDIELNILSHVLGDLADQTNERKNELQVRGGFVSAEDRLREISLSMSRLRTHSDYKMLALKYGADSVMVEAFYGSDFFLESQDKLYELFELSPNPIERKNILIRLSKNRNKFNKDKSEREVLLYNLMPYVSDKDFDKAVEQFAVDKTIFALQTRFNYWISLFEANYGDLLQFYNGLGDASNASKLLLINNLIKDLIDKAIVPELTTNT